MTTSSYATRNGLRRHVVVAAATLLILAFRTAGGAVSVPDLSGAWKLDPARSTSTGGGRGGGRGTGGGLGLGQSADALSIRQSAKQMTIDERRGTTTTQLTYSLDGQPTTNVLGAGRNTGAPAVFVSQWKNDQLVTTITVPVSEKNSAAARYQEARYLDRDGALVVETTVPAQPNARKVVYVRAPERR